MKRKTRLMRISKYLQSLKTKVKKKHLSQLNPTRLMKKLRGSLVICLEEVVAPSKSRYRGKHRSALQAAMI